MILEIGCVFSPRYIPCSLILRLFSQKPDEKKLWKFGWKFLSENAKSVLFDKLEINPAMNPIPLLADIAVSEKKLMFLNKYSAENPMVLFCFP